MRRTMIFCTTVACILSLPAVSLAQEDAPDDAIAYAVGFEAGSYILERIQSDGVEVDIDDLLLGIQDALRQAESRLDAERTRVVLQRLEDEVRGREAERLMQTDPVFRALAAENLRASDEFHRSFGAGDGIVSLENGIQYQVLAEGAGESPGEHDTVSVTFDADLIDGNRFADGTRVNFVVSDISEGARYVIQRMQTGDHWIVAIPPDLAFGLGGRPPEVGPNETIILEIRLHSFESKQ